MPDLDDADRRILRLMQQDATLSTQGLADAAGLSTSPAWRRLRRLIETGVIDRQVALVPPVSGGAFRLVADPIDVDAVIAEVADERAGAIATFLGTTRIESRGRTVVHLEYEAYEGMAEKVMAEIANGLATRYELCKVAITHRVGRVGIGETSVAIAVSAPHREHALAACKEAIDTLKVEVPLWKKEVYEGGEEWIGRGS